MKVVAPSGDAMIGPLRTIPGESGPRALSYALPRTTFDTILRRAAEAAGAEVREGVKVENLVYDRAPWAGWSHAKHIGPSS